MLSGYPVIRPDVHQLSVRQHLFRVTLYHRTQRTDSNETRQNIRHVTGHCCQNFKGQRTKVKVILTYNGGGIHFDASRLIYCFYFSVISINVL